MCETSLQGRSFKTWLAAFLTVILSASLVQAQGFYYKEIHKDGRIYVFNIAEEADRFEKSGEMGRGVTRPARGPTARRLSGTASALCSSSSSSTGSRKSVPEPPVPIQRIEWRDGKTRITTDLAYLEISNRVQVRYTHEFPNDEITLPRTGSRRCPRLVPDPAREVQARRVVLEAEQPDLRTAAELARGDGIEYRRVPRGRQYRLGSDRARQVPDARRSVQGSVLPPAADIFWQSELRRSLARLGRVRARPRHRLCRAGRPLQQQARIPCGRSSTATDLHERSTTTPRSRRTRGSCGSRTATRSSCSGHGSAGRCTPKRTSSRRRSPLYAFGLNYEHNDFHGTTTGVDLKSDIVSVDGIFKFKGVCATGAYFWREREARDGRLSSTPMAGTSRPASCSTASAPGKGRSGTATAR